MQMLWIGLGLLLACIFTQVEGDMSCYSCSGGELGDYETVFNAQLPAGYQDVVPHTSACKDIDPEVKADNVQTISCNGQCMKMRFKVEKAGIDYVMRSCMPSQYPCQETKLDEQGVQLITTCCDGEICNKGSRDAVTSAVLILLAVFSVLFFTN